MLFERDSSLRAIYIAMVTLTVVILLSANVLGNPVVNSSSSQIEYVATDQRNFQDLWTKLAKISQKNGTSDTSPWNIYFESRGLNEKPKTLLAHLEKIKIYAVPIGIGICLVIFIVGAYFAIGISLGTKSEPNGDFLL